MHAMTAAQLGAALGGLSETAVLEREHAGELFSVRRPARQRACEYPAFQAWPGIAGLPLRRVMRVLAPLGATDVYGFFAAPTELLGGLTPIEALTGRWAVGTGNRALDAEAQGLLASPMPERLEAVLHAGQALVALRAA